MKRNNVKLFGTRHLEHGLCEYRKARDNTGRTEVEVRLAHIERPSLNQAETGRTALVNKKEMPEMEAKPDGAT